MTPYYADDFVTIYHGDCREWMPEADVIVTDPPYGIDYRSNQGGRLVQGVLNDENCQLRDEILELWSPRPALVFGSRKMPVPKGTRDVLIWDKGEGVGMGALDIPWKPNHEEIYVIGAGWQGHRSSGVIRSNGPNGYAQIGGDGWHPTMKPVALLRMLLPKCPPGTVLDPFMGSGTTLRAAKDLGRKAIGIEIEERYCEIAATRCSQEVLGLVG